jgi:pantetheine-phosphate adenylyltransferase
LTCLAVYPGTFDPIHFGHVDIATRAAGVFDELVLAVYDRPMKNLMFNIDERVALAQEALAHLPNVRVSHYGGLTMEFARQTGAQVIVRGLRAISDFELEYQMALTNRQLAPEIETVCLMTNQDHAFLSSSILKEIVMLEGDASGMAPAHVITALERKRVERKAGNKPVPLVSLRD